MAAWTKLLQDLGPYSKSRAWAERGKLFRCEGLPSTQGKPKNLPLHYLGWSQWPFHGIGYILRSLQFKGMCHTLMIPQPMPSVLHRRQLWFSQLIPPFVSALWILVSSTSRKRSEPYPPARQGAWPQLLFFWCAARRWHCQNQRCCLNWSHCSLHVDTQVSPAVVITAQLKRFGICSNG